MAISVFTHSLSMLCGDRISSNFVVQADGFVDLFVEFLAALDVVWCEPAAHAFVLKIGVEAVGKGLVLGGVADGVGVAQLAEQLTLMNGCSVAHGTFQ
ncbi:MAG: hypothetical protein WAM78_19295 [Candidatus Sulfotelmatobacter sp.]